MNLTPKQSRFVQLYLEPGQKGYFNATQAAIGAGYSEKTAGQIGERLLKKVEIQKVIGKAQSKTAEKSEITRERWLREMACIAFLDPLDIFEDDGSVKLVKNIPENARRALGSFDVSEIFDAAEGDQKSAIGLLKKIKFHSKPEALRDMGKALGFLKDGGEINVNLRFAYDTPEIKQ